MIVRLSYKHQDVLVCTLCEATESVGKLHVFPLNQVQHFCVGPRYTAAWELPPAQPVKMRR